jgi:hypothetical protein
MKVIFVFSVLVASFSVFSSAQSKALTDFECRTNLNIALKNVCILDPLNPGAYSFVLRMDTTQSIGRQTNTVTGLLRWNDNRINNKRLKAELWTVKNGQPVHRLLADGRKVWAYNVLTNDYSVNAYDNNYGNRSATYDDDFLNYSQAPIQGLSANLMNLGMQIGFKSPLIKDWLPGYEFKADISNPAKQVIYQTTPNGSRYVTFTIIAGIAGQWNLDTVVVYQADRVGREDRITNSVIKIERDEDGNPLSVSANSPDFTFSAPRGAKVLASSRTIKIN